MITFKPRVRSRLLVAVMIIMALSSSLGGVPAAARGDGLETLGEMKLPWVPEGEFGVWITPVAVDAKAQRLYVLVKRSSLKSVHLAEFDTSTAVPTPLRFSQASVTTAQIVGPYVAALDSKRHRLLVASTKHEDEGNRTVVDVIDLKTLKNTATWELTLSVPGFVAYGLTYHAASDDVYLVGELSGAGAADIVLRTPGRPVAPGPSVVAVDGGAGSFKWIRPIPGCRSILKPNTGAFIGRSAQRPALYTFCDSGGAAANLVLTGQSAVARIHIDDDADAQEALNFPVELFPVSGTYLGENVVKRGVVGFDPVAERVFAQSLSPTTAGGWAFDGLRSAWVGFVGSPKAENYYLGVNPANGRYYLAGGASGTDGYINVTNGRATPLAQGYTFTGIRPQSFLVPDPGSRRIFLMAAIVTKPAATETEQAQTRLALVTLRDDTPRITPLPRLDYDLLTSDLADRDASIDFSGSASGFGAKWELVGGIEGSYGRVGGGQRVFIPGDIIQGVSTGATGDRGMTLGSVPRVDVRPAGASATATAAAVDDATQSDRTDAVNRAPADSGVAETVSFPYHVQTCLDGHGERAEPKEGEEGDLGRAAVVCDFKKQESKGSAAFADRVGAGGVSVLSGSFDTKTHRDAKRGVVTKSTAIAEGVALRLPNGTRVVIDRIETTAETVANGRPGTAQVMWERSVEGVTTVDAAGKRSPAQSCTSVVRRGAKAKSTGDCNALERQINETLSTEMRVRFPLPRATATPRGAFASVEKSENEFLDGLTTNNDDFGGVPGMEAVVFNDGGEKSRLLVQLAAIRADSIFTRSASPTYDDFGPIDPGIDVPTGDTSGTAGVGDVTTTDGSSGALDSSVAAGDTGATGDLAPVAAGTGAIATGIPPALGWLIGRRGALDATLAAGVWLVFFAALSGVWRRRRLIDTVGD